MTAAEQPRDEGGRFASRECPTTYRLLAAIQPRTLRPDVAVRESGGWSVEAPRCPHGHFARWASRNCRACR